MSRQSEAKVNDWPHEARGRRGTESSQVRRVGEQVAAVQRFLVSAGYLLDVDAAEGPLTRSAVRDYRGRRDPAAWNRRLAKRRVQPPADVVFQMDSMMGRALLRDGGDRHGR